jgi:hypothetical protein
VKLQQRQLRSVSPVGPSTAPFFYSLLAAFLFVSIVREAEPRASAGDAPCAPPRTQYAARHGAAPRLAEWQAASMERSGKSLRFTDVFRRLAGLPSHYNALQL